MEATPNDDKRRSLHDIRADLHKPIPQRLLKTKKQGGATLTFCPWYRTQKILDHYTNGFWHSEVRDVRFTADRIFLTVRVSIESQEGVVYREATGTELLKKTDDRTGEVSEIPYGDPSSNAESMAFRRACAKHGLGAHLYDED